MSEKFWMVWSPKGRAPVYRHDTKEDAIAESNRLARTNQGKQFFVLEAIGVSMIEEVSPYREIADPEIPF